MPYHLRLHSLFSGMLWLTIMVRKNNALPFKVAFALLGYAMAKNYGKEE